MRFLTRVSVLAVIIFLLCQPCAWGEKKDKQLRESNEPILRQINFNIVPFLTAGKTTGKASEYLEYLSDNFADKILYGGGLSLYHHPHPRYAIGLNFEYLIKDIPETYLDPARGFQYSVSFIYFLRSMHKSRPYGRIDLGILSAKVPNYPQDGEDMDLGSHEVFRFGLGLFTFTSTFTNTRFELYYKRAFSEGHRIEDYFNYEIDFDAQCIGLEAAIGVAL